MKNTTRTAIVGVTLLSLLFGAAVPSGASAAPTVTSEQAIAVGYGSATAIPLLPEGLSYVDATGGAVVPLFLRSDGNAVAGPAPCGSVTIPPLPSGVTYVDIAAGSLSVAALVRSDGQLLLIGCGGGTVPDVAPTLPPGVRYEEVSMAADMVAALRSDGRVAIFSLFRTKEVEDYGGPGPISMVTESNGYTKSVVGGAEFVMLLTSSGRVKVVDTRHCCYGPDTKPRPTPAMKVPSLPKGIRFIDFDTAAGSSAFIRSDGKVALVTRHGSKKIVVPKLPRGLKYRQVEAGGEYLLLLRSDGQAVSAGFDPVGFGYLHVPAIAKGHRIFHVAAGAHSIFLTEPIPAGTKVSTSISKVARPATVKRGKKVGFRVKVFSMADTTGGKMKITYKGKTIGTGVVKADSVARIKVDTGKLPKSSRNELSVVFLGKGPAAKSTSATKAIVHLRTR